MYIIFQFENDELFFFEQKVLMNTLLEERALNGYGENRILFYFYKL